MSTIPNYADSTIDDDGSKLDRNKVKFATIRTDLTDPIRDFVQDNLEQSDFSRTSAPSSASDHAGSGFGVGSLIVDVTNNVGYINVDATTSNGVWAQITILGTNNTFTGTNTFSGTVNLSSDAVDAIGEIASGIKSGSDATLVTGTAGTNGNLIQWNADGDAVDSGSSVADLQQTNEEIQDIVGAMFSGNTETLISATYQDADGTIDLVVSESSIDHDNLTNFVDDEHIDHSSVSITAGDGLTGGGTIASTRTINLDISGLSAMTAAPAGTDEFLYNDGGTMKTMSYNEAATFSNTDSGAHTFVSTDVGGIRYYTGTGGHTWTMNSGIGQNNCWIMIVNSGSGNLTIAGGSATVSGASGLVVQQNGIAVLVRESSTQWFMGGTGLQS